MNKIIINIGRQFGSGGKDVADKIGEKLGIPVYDNELLSKAAQDFGFTEEQGREKEVSHSLFDILLKPFWRRLLPHG